VGAFTSATNGVRSLRSIISVPAMKASGMVRAKAVRMVSSCAAASGRS
jgi:hypothetical protein